MPIVPGKPGTLRVRGRQRAQLQRVDDLSDALLAYQAKLQALVPQVLFMTNAQVTIFQNAALACEQLLTQKNT